MARSDPSQSAFTLIELLVVITIIAMLIALLLPSLSRARQVSYAVRSLSNLGQLALATVNYEVDHDGWLPDWGAITRDPTTLGPPAYMTRAYSWPTKYGLLATDGYMTDYKLWLDPGDLGLRQFLQTPRSYMKLAPVPDGNTWVKDKYYTFSYTMAGHMQKPNTANVNTLTSWFAGSVADRITNFREPSLDMVYGEENTGYVEGTYYPSSQSYGPTVINDGGFNGGDWTEPRHLDESQADFLDGSARHIPAMLQPMAIPAKGKYNPWNRNFRYTPAP